MKKYTGPAVQFSIEREDGSTERIWLRPKAPKLIVASRGKISLPEYLQEQGELSIQLEKLTKDKKATPLQVANLRSKLSLPDMLSASYPGDHTSLWDIAKTENDFEIDSVEEATEEVKALRAEMAELKLALEKATTESASAPNIEVKALLAEITELKLALEKATTTVSAPAPSTPEKITE